MKDNKCPVRLLFSLLFKSPKLELRQWTDRRNISAETWLINPAGSGDSPAVMDLLTLDIQLLCKNPKYTSATAVRQFTCFYCPPPHTFFNDTVLRFSPKNILSLNLHYFIFFWLWSDFWHIAGPKHSKCRISARQTVFKPLLIICL